jgi:Ser/Thr protein kinase RdoA (MazF antagonist)
VNSIIILFEVYIDSNFVIGHPPFAMSLLFLADLLAAYPSWCRPMGPIRALGNAGGLSGAQLYRFDAPAGPLLARAWPVDGPDATRLATIHAWLRRAAPLGVVPVPIAARDGRTWRAHAGRLWQVEPWRPGSPDPARPPNPIHLLAALAMLGRFHAALAPLGRTGLSPGLAARLTEIENLRAGGFRRLRDALRAGPAGALQDLALTWLDEAERHAPAVAAMLGQCVDRMVSLQPCLRDCRPEHFLFVGDAVTGLVDFGAMDVECPAADLARLLSEWGVREGPLRLDALAAHNAEDPLDPRSASLIAPFERSAALLRGARWVRWQWIEQRGFDPEVVGRALRRAVERIEALGAVAATRQS